VKTADFSALLPVETLTEERSVGAVALLRSGKNYCLWLWCLSNGNRRTISWHWCLSKVAVKTAVLLAMLHVEVLAFVESRKYWNCCCFGQ